MKRVGSEKRNGSVVDKFDEFACDMLIMNCAYIN